MQRVAVPIRPYGLALLAIGQQQFIAAGDDPILRPGHVLLHQCNVVEKGTVGKEGFEPLSKGGGRVLQKHALRQRTVALLDQQGELKSRHDLRDDFRD